MSTNTCDNCGTACGPDDVFCEQCGYDFLTGSLPEEPAESSLEAPSVLAPDRAGAVEAELPMVVLEVSADRDYFDAVVSDGEVEFPDPAPEPQRMELSGYQLHIGRASDSRAIHPEIDLAELTGDQAVSGRHAVIRIDPGGEVTLADVGSTNGTLVGELESDPMIEGVPMVFGVDQAAYLGAWTKIVRIA